MNMDKNKGGFKVVSGPKQMSTGCETTVFNSAANCPQKDLQEVRIIQTNLVFLNGLDPKHSKEEILKKKQYMGQYGNIKKIIVKPEGNKDQNSVGVYISFSSPSEASIAILALDQFELESKPLRAFYGSTKYCNSFLTGQQCIKKDCPYLHEKAKDYTFYKDQRFYINYKEIALKIVNQKISFYSNYSATLNPVFPDVMIVLNSLKSSLQISQTAPTTLKSSDQSKNASVIINVTTCTWDEDINDQDYENTNNNNNQNNKLNQKTQQNENYYNTDNIMTSKDIEAATNNTNDQQMDIFQNINFQTTQISPLYDQKFIQSDQNSQSYINFVEATRSKLNDLNFQPDTAALNSAPLSKLLLQQQAYHFNTNNSLQTTDLDYQNLSLGSQQQQQFNFDSFNPHENPMFMLQNNINKNSYFTFNPIWGPVGQKVLSQQDQKGSMMSLQNYKYGFFQGSDYQNQDFSYQIQRDEDEFSALNKLIVAYNLKNYLRIPKTNLAGLNEKIFKSLIYNEKISQYNFSEYMFGQEWMQYFQDELLFSEEEREMIISAARNSFSPQLKLYLDIASQSVDLFNFIIDQKMQLNEVQSIFSTLPNQLNKPSKKNSQKQRKRSSNSLQSTNHSSMGGELTDVFLDEGKHNEENAESFRNNNNNTNIDSRNLSVKRKQYSNNEQSTVQNTTQKDQFITKNASKTSKSYPVTQKNPLSVNNYLEKQSSKENLNQEFQKVGNILTKTESSNSNNSKLAQQKITQANQSLPKNGNNSKSTITNSMTKQNSKASQQSEIDSLSKKKSESNADQNQEDDFVSIQPKGVTLKQNDLDDKKGKERTDNNMFTFLENEQEEDEDKEKDEVNKAKLLQDANAQSQKKSKQIQQPVKPVKPVEKVEKKPVKKVNLKQIEQQQLKDEKKKRKEEYQLLNEQLNLIKQEKEKNKQKIQEQKILEAQQQEAKRKQKELAEKQQQELKRKQAEEIQKMEAELILRKEVQVFSSFVEYPVDNVKIRQDIIKCLEEGKDLKYLEDKLGDIKFIDNSNNASSNNNNNDNTNNAANNTNKDKDKKKKKKKADKANDIVKKELNNLVNINKAEIAQGIKLTQNFVDEIQIKGQIVNKFLLSATTSETNCIQINAPIDYCHPENNSSTKNKKTSSTKVPDIIIKKNHIKEHHHHHHHHSNKNRKDEKDIFQDLAQKFLKGNHIHSILEAQQFQHCNFSIRLKIDDQPMYQGIPQVDFTPED